LGEDAIGDIRGLHSSKKINELLEPGETGIAFFYAGDTSISEFKEHSLDIKISENPFFRQAAFDIILDLKDIIYGGPTLKII